MVARLWLDHGLPPSEIMSAPPDVVDRALELVAERAEARAYAAAKAADQAQFAELRRLLGPVG